MKQWIYIIIIIILIILNIFQYNKNKRIVEINNVETIRQDTIIVRDTLKFYKPKPIYVKSELDTIYIESIDSTVVMNKETKVYRDSTYEAQISGFQPNLDHISVFPKTTYITTEKTSYIEKKKHFNHGLQVGVGFGVINRKPDVFVGYGVQYNF